MKALSIAIVAALATLGASAATGARADDAAKEQFIRRLFAGDVSKDKKEYACFVRQYDQAHLVRHPLQKVSAMKLLVTTEIMPEAESRNHSFRLGVKFRNRPGDFDSSGECGHADMSDTPNAKPQLGCSVDCDGGGIAVELKDDNKAVLVKLDRVRIWQRNKPDDEGLGLSGGADDRVFRLDRVSLEQCRSLITDRKELAALRRK